MMLENNFQSGDDQGFFFHYFNEIAFCVIFKVIFNTFLFDVNKAFQNRKYLDIRCDVGLVHSMTLKIYVWCYTTGSY